MSRRSPTARRKIRARFRAAGGDSDRVSLVNLDKDDKGNFIPLSFPDDYPRIRALLEETGARLMIVDPIMAFLGEGTNSHNDASVRRALMPLKELAQEFDCAIVMVRHLNKAGEMKAQYRGGGSVAFLGLARSGLIAHEHPEEKGLVVLAQTKANLAKMMQGSFTYRVESWDEDEDLPIVEWYESLEITADQLMKPDSRDTAPAREECWNHLKLLLDEQDPRPAKEMEALLKEAGHSKSTIDRTKREKNIRSVRLYEEGKIKGWSWTMQTGIRIGKEPEPSTQT